MTPNLIRGVLLAGRIYVSPLKYVLRHCPINFENLDTLMLMSRRPHVLIIDFFLDRAAANYNVMDWLFLLVLQFTPIRTLTFQPLRCPRLSTDRRPFSSWESEGCGLVQFCEGTSVLSGHRSEEVVAGGGVSVKRRARPHWHITQTRRITAALFVVDVDDFLYKVRYPISFLLNVENLLEVRFHGVVLLTHGGQPDHVLIGQGWVHGTPVETYDESGIRAAVSDGKNHGVVYLHGRCCTLSDERRLLG